MSSAKSINVPHVADDSRKPSSQFRLNANSLAPVVLAIKKSAARQVIIHGHSGKVQDMINYVLLAASHKKNRDVLDQLYKDGQEWFEYCQEHGDLPPDFETDFTK